MEPPSLLVCINKNSRIHDSLVLESEFCINLLSKEQENLSNVCSDEEKYDQRFDDKNWNHEGVPYLQNAQSNIFCKIDKLTSYHTHTVVIGTVLDSMFKDNIATLTYVDGKYE